MVGIIFSIKICLIFENNLPEIYCRFAKFILLKLDLMLEKLLDLCCCDLLLQYKLKPEHIAYYYYMLTWGSPPSAYWSKTGSFSITANMGIPFPQMTSTDHPNTDVACSGWVFVEVDVYLFGKKVIGESRGPTPLPLNGKSWIRQCKLLNWGNAC